MTLSIDGLCYGSIEPAINAGVGFHGILSLGGDNIGFYCHERSGGLLAFLQSHSTRVQHQVLQALCSSTTPQPFAQRG